ncbi:MAG: HAMP domain-containing histidine kinase [Xanthomonadales bacterium]|nr:HAMP domain-containing histidine kinase [Xanthomonadales bacterium]
MPRIPESGAGLSLSLRLALSLSALILLLGLLALLAIGRMTERLQQAVGESAGAVGRSLVQVLRTSRLPMNEAQMRAEDQAAEVARIQALVLQAQAEGAREEAARANAQAEIHQAIDQAMREAVAAGPGLQREVRVEVNGRELAPQDIAALTDSLAERIDPDAVRFEVLRERGEARLQVIGLGPELRIELPSSPVERALDEFRRQLLWALGGLLLFGMLGASLIARRLTRPLQALAQGAAALGRGEAGVQVRSAGPPELRASIDAFNRMSADLARVEAEASVRREQRALAELGEIGRGLAHSLRNPLHALGLSLEALAARSDGGDAAQLRAAGREQLARIDQALRGFLALASGEGAQAEPVWLGEIIDDVLLEARQRCGTRVELLRELAPVSLRGVRAELRILVHTLVLNAIEAAPAGTTVRVSCRAEAAGVRIEVEDAGPGVPETVRARLFEPHVSSKPTGAGMGLYLSQRLARQRYGGGIDLQPRQPQGTCAVLHLNDRREEGMDAD